MYLLACRILPQWHLRILDHLESVKQYQCTGFPGYLISMIFDLASLLMLQDNKEIIKKDLQQPGSRAQS